MEDESQHAGEIKEVLSFQRSSSLTSIALSRDGQHLLVGDGSVSNVYVCQVGERLRLRTISYIQSPTGIAVTECGTVFLSSSKENALFSLKEEEMLQGTETLTKVSGGTADHCDGVKSVWNMPSSSCAYRNTVFVCDTGKKAIRMLTSAKGLIPLQSRVARYANVFRIDKQAREDDLPVTFDDHVRLVQEVVPFLSSHEQEALERT